MKKFYSSIEEILLGSEPLASQLKLMRDLLTKLLKSNQLKLDCVSEILNGMEASQGNEWAEPDFYYHEQLKFSVRMIFWPAFYENNPHQHKTWSITGVFSNFLRVSTYELLSTPARLKRERTIDASAGEVGYLIPGCIHSVTNPTHEQSGSIHIFNNIDYGSPEENAIWYPAPRKHNLSKGSLERALMVCIAVCNQIKEDNSLVQLIRIYNIAPINLKLLALQAIYGFDRNIGREYFEKLEAIL